MNTEHFRKLEQMYLGANINQIHYGTTTCTISEGSAVIGLTIDPSYFHALNAMHGSVYFKLLDDAAFFAVNSMVEDVFVLTKTFHIQFKRPVTGGHLVAKGVLTKQGTHEYEAKAELWDEEGKVVGFGEGIFVKSKVELTPEIGYR